MRLPGFLIEEEVGLGDLIKKATYAMGIKPCGGCEKRATALNRWMTFSRWHWQHNRFCKEERRWNNLRLKIKSKP